MEVMAESSSLFKKLYKDKIFDSMATFMKYDKHDKLSL